MRGKHVCHVRNEQHLTQIRDNQIVDKKEKTKININIFPAYFWVFKVILNILYLIVQKPLGIEIVL